MKRKQIKTEKAITQYKRSLAKKRNRISDSVFKSGMFVAIAIAVVFVAALVIMIYQAGSQTFMTDNGPGANWGYFLTGNIYNSGSNLFASGVLLVNQIWTTFLAILIATPIGVGTALFITRVAPSWMKGILLFSVTMLAAVPSVVFGTFGMKVIDPAIKNMFGLRAGGVTLSIVITLVLMVLPTITLISTSAINVVDNKMEQSSLALGATKTQTSMFITLRAASGGILVAVILAVGRVMGEASAVSMVAAPRSSSGLTDFNLFDNIRLLTATMLQGHGEIGDPLKKGMLMSQAMLLITSIFVIFGAMKYIEGRYNLKNIAKRQIKQAAKDAAIIERFKAQGIDGMSRKDAARYRHMVRAREKQIKILKSSKAKHDEAEKMSALSESVKRFRNNSAKAKRIKSNGIGVGTGVLSVIGVAALIGIVVFLFVVGGPALNWDFVGNTTHTGLAVPFLNTIMSILITLAIATPLGIAAGVYFSEYIKKDSGQHKLLGSMFDLLTGIPSLVFGMVGTLVILPWMKNSMIAISIIMSFMILPTIIRTTEQALGSVDNSLKEGSLALGAQRSKTALSVILPKAAPQILSGVFLGAGRVVGESAAIVFMIGIVVPADSSMFGMFEANGKGVTLATKIFQLKKQYGEFGDQFAMNQMAATGIVILGMILYLRGIASQAEKKDWLMFAIITTGFAIGTAGIVSGNMPLFFTGAVTGAAIPLTKTSVIGLNNRYHFFNLNKKLTFSFRLGNNK